MTNNENSMNIQIGKDLILPIIENKIKTAIIEAMGNQKTLVEQVVEKVLLQKVNKDGRVSSSSYENTFNFIDTVLRGSIERACMETIKQFVTEKEPQIKEELIKQLNSKKGMSAFASSLLQATLDATKNQYSLTAEIVIGAKS